MKQLVRFFIVSLIGCVTVSGLGCSRFLNKMTSMTIVYSSDILGELDNCGCSEGQFGGLPRKAAALDVIRQAVAHAIHLDAGNLFFQKAPQNDIERSQMLLKSEYIVKGYNTMGCEALNIGQTDLLLGLDALQQLQHQALFPFVSSNIFYRATGKPVFKQSSICQVDGLKVAILGVCPPDAPHADSLVIADPADAVREALKTVESQSDMVILLSTCGMETDKRLAAQFPAVRIIVSGNTGTESLTGTMSAPIAVVSVKKQGQHLGRLDVTIEQSPFASIASLTFNSSLIPLNDKLTGDTRIATLVKDYTARVNGMNKQALFKKKRETLGQSVHTEYTYTGADACTTCHPAQYDNWLQTAHAGAYKTLVDKGRNFDTECLSCHTTGYGETGGYDVSQADASPLLNVQCESCHGPGSNHKEKGTILRTVGPEVCVSCHAEQHSPRFDYKEYVPLIACPSGH